MVPLRQLVSLVVQQFSTKSLQPDERRSDAILGAGSKLSAYGHMAVRRLLGKETFADSFAQAPMVAQFSSLGSLNEDWLREFRESMASGLNTRGAWGPLVMGAIL